MYVCYNAKEKEKFMTSLYPVLPVLEGGGGGGGKGQLLPVHKINVMPRFHVR